MRENVYKRREGRDCGMTKETVREMKRCEENFAELKEVGHVSR